MQVGPRAAGDWSQLAPFNLRRFVSNLVISHDGLPFRPCEYWFPSASRRAWLSCCSISLSRGVGLPACHACRCVVCDRDSVIVTCPLHGPWSSTPSPMPGLCLCLELWVVVVHVWSWRCGGTSLVISLWFECNAPAEFVESFKMAPSCASRDMSRDGCLCCSGCTFVFFEGARC